MEIPAKFIHIGFIDLLCDAIFNYRRAIESKDSYGLNRSARASITASFLSIECCANILLRELDVAKSTLNDYDRLPSISKIETYLHISNCESNIDRGDNRVQKIIELIKVRNNFVHPKSQNINTDIGLPEDKGEVWMLPMSLEGELHKELGIPKCAMFWNADNALSVLHAIFDFYDYLFGKLIPRNEKAPLLLNRVEFENVIMPNSFSEFDAELNKAKELGLKVDSILKRVNT